MPVFWACGVTPQAAIAVARPEFCITHYPGAMLVTDRLINEFADRVTQARICARGVSAEFRHYLGGEQFK